MSPEASEEALKMQQRQKRWLVRDALEVAVTSTISHPHIVQVHEYACGMPAYLWFVVRLQCDMLYVVLFATRGSVGLPLTPYDPGSAGSMGSVGVPLDP